MTFPSALRGYDRAAVDAYVVRVNSLIAEIESTRSPESAIRRALESVGEETSRILQSAQETSEELTARSRAQAEDRFERARQEAQRVRDDAAARVREFEADAERVRQERRQLINELRELAQELVDVADRAGGRVVPGDPEQEPAEPVATSDPTSDLEAEELGIGEDATAPIPVVSPAPEPRDEKGERPRP